MIVLINTTLIINLMLLLVFAVGSYFILNKDMQPKIKANLATLIVTFVFIHSMCMCLISGYGIVQAKLSYVLAILFVMMLFVFGRLVKYETLNKYAIFQFLAFCSSFAYLLLIK